MFGVSNESVQGGSIGSGGWALNVVRVRPWSAVCNRVELIPGHLVGSKVL